jgi:hypothetical protein
VYDKAIVPSDVCDGHILVENKFVELKNVPHAQINSRPHDENDEYLIVRPRVA